MLGENTKKAMPEGNGSKLPVIVYTCGIDGSRFLNNYQCHSSNGEKCLDLFSTKKPIEIPVEVIGTDKEREYLRKACGMEEVSEQIRCRKI